jgi:hypothetical protein
LKLGRILLIQGENKARNEVDIGRCKSDLDSCECDRQVMPLPKINMAKISELKALCYKKCIKLSFKQDSVLNP